MTCRRYVLTQEKDKIINEYAKIINGTKKEYQKLYTENIKYRDK